MLKTLIYLFAFFFVILALIIGFIFYGLYQFYMPIGGAGEKTFEVEPGQGVKQIGASLEQQNLIRSSFWFEAYAWLSDKQGKLQAGQYSINQTQSIAQIVQMISGGKIIANDIWVTIPEGFTFKQIKAKIIEAGLETAKEIGNETVDDFKSNYEILADSPKGSGLQGFLFPDTYKFKKDVSSKEILIKMLDNFDLKLTPKMRQDIKQQGRSIFEIITMASILEKEVKTSNDRKIASGIFWKRIGDKYPLESDATLSYIFGDTQTRHTQEQTKIDSPYNTYKYIGLPPGPINNPGLEAIEAAIYPENTDYYFFLTKPDTGEAVFAKTLQEHNVNKIKYLK